MARSMSSAIRALSASRSAGVLAAFAGLACASSASAQLGASINPDLRPLVDVQVTNAPAAGSNAWHFLGLIDTGAQSSYISPQVNSVLTLASVPAGGPGQPALPLISQTYDFNVGGFLGRRLDGPQINNGANITHRLTGSTAGAGANTAARSMNVNLDYFNGAINLVNIGQNFLMNNPAAAPGGAPSGGSVLMVDPIHAFAAPINFTATTLPGTTQLNGAVNWRSSSLGMLALNSVFVPTTAINANPNFLLTLNFTAPPAGGYVNTRSDAGRGAHTAADPTLNLTVAQRNFINQQLGFGGMGQPPGIGANPIADTGAPTSGSGPNPGEDLLGTDFLNRFGQYWNYNGANPNIMLFAPLLQGDRDTISRGMLMTVDRSSQGGFLTGVQQMRQAGPPTATRVGTTSTPATADVADQAGIGIYRAHGSTSNAVYVAGRDAMGLQAGPNGDQIDGMKLGADSLAPSVTIQVLRPDRYNSMVHFSVSADSQGQASGDGNITIGGGVRRQSTLGQVAGDIFFSTSARPSNNAGQGTNNLRFNQDVLGLQGNAGPLVSAAGRGNHDNLRDFDLRPDFGMVDSSRSLRNIDPAIRSVGDTTNPMGAAQTGSLPARTDQFQSNFYTYYSLTSNSSTVITQNTSGASIYTTSNAGAPTVWATPALMGLVDGDDIDAFSLQRVYDAGFGITPSSVAPIPGTVATQGGLLIGGRFDPNPFENFGRIDFTFNNDLIVFSLAPGSPTLALMSGFLGRALSAADLFISDFDGSFTLWASAESLGLRPQDNIDGLDITAIPAPGATMIISLAGLTVLSSRRRRA